ncbi:J domain-containing protein [Hymenobacter latericus]|uniref:J domain-containing protein n=1 Tax=Hymenobacter sp. YIM 151858-1 TaxID=2987688 RepID=UPI00222758A8|nr:J domain-containing protein [Hymenobacter sp. YIM 151858-1]UYZ57827.1 DnaJ domain-containing protein [Hymenobacter sp. YIM 151858-1]
MTTYYQVLELTEQATAHDIRRAYLRLVRLTHPDRTPDPVAHQRYLLVNDAYDTLRHPATRARYDAQLAALRNPLLASAPPPAYAEPFPGNAYQVLRVPYSATAAHIHQAYQRLRAVLQANTVDPALRQYLQQVEHAYATLNDPRLRPSHDARVKGQRPARGPDPLAEQYVRYAPLARRLCWAALVFFGLLLVDMSWTLRFAPDPVASVEYHIGSRRGSPSYYWVKTSHAAFRSAWNYQVGEPLEVRRSALFRQVRAYRSATDAAAPLIDYSSELMYGALFFFPLVMAASAGFGAWPGSSPKRTVDNAIVVALLAIIVLYLMVSY